MTQRTEMIADQTLTALTNLCVRAAEDAACLYVRQNADDPSALGDRLFVALKDGITDAVESALDDAREAVDAGMSGYAVPTMRATMRLFGIDAAKRALGES